MTWQPVCSSAQLQPDCGVPVLLKGHPVAVFRTVEGALFAVGNIDPFCGAGVISRGIVGDRDGEPTVTSPMLKQVFSLRTGRCFDQPDTAIPTYPIRQRADIVEIGLP